MRSLKIVLSVAGVVTFAAAGHSGHSGHGHYESSGKEVVIPPSTRPSVIDESGHSKTCPHGFNALGKQCAKTVSVPAEYHCPSGTVRTEDGEACAKYSGKVSECPPGFVKEGNKLCFRKSTADAIFTCPNGYFSTGSGSSCTRLVELPRVAYCPGGSVLKGESCVTEVSEAPEYVCAPGYTAEGRKCKIEETYDCTPVREATKGTETTYHGHSGGHHGHHRLLGHAKSGHSHHSSPSVTVGKSQPAPTSQEIVLNKTCKRIRTEPAKKICKEGISSGKVCIVDVVEDALTKPGGYTEETARAIVSCPEGYSGAGSSHLESHHHGHGGHHNFHSGKDICSKIEETAPQFFCSGGAEDIGNRCATYKPLQTRCPEGFGEDNGNCVKVVYAAPIVEYAVTYRCTGKNCDSTSSTSDGHHHHH